MEIIKDIFYYLAEIIAILGISIMIYGFTKLVVKYFRVEARSVSSTPIKYIQNIRRAMGIYILLALDFLIASDLIHTVTELTQERLIELSVMIILRTAIGYFLGKEVNEIEAKVKEV